MKLTKLKDKIEEFLNPETLDRDTMFICKSEAQTVLELIERFEKIDQLTEQLNADSDTEKYIRKISDINQKDLNEPMTI